MRPGTVFEQSRRNIYLDLLRGAACISVMLFHYTTRYNELFGHKFDLPISFPDGGKAVALFFLLSGYFAVFRVDKTGALTYAVKRFFKLYPVYWAAIVIIFPLTALFLPTRSVSASNALINLTMLQGFIGIDNVDGAFWTLQYELMFYVLIGLIIVCKLDKHIDMLCITWVFVRVITVFLPNVLLFNYFRKAFEMFCLGNAYGHMFIAGAIIQCIEKRIKSKDTSRGNKAYTVILALCLVLCVGLQFHVHGLKYGIIFSCFIALILVSVILYQKKLNYPKVITYCAYPVIFISSVSYPLYLVHQNLGYIVIQKLEGIGFNNELVLLIPVLLMILIAYLLNRFIEKPSSGLCKRICSKIGQR